MLTQTTLFIKPSRLHCPNWHTPHLQKYKSSWNTVVIFNEWAAQKGMSIVHSKWMAHIAEVAFKMSARLFCLKQIPSDVTFASLTKCSYCNMWFSLNGQHMRNGWLTLPSWPRDESMLVLPQADPKWGGNTMSHLLVLQAHYSLWLCVATLIIQYTWSGECY